MLDAVAGPVTVVVVLTVPALLLYRWLQRRAAFRAFARARGLRYRGVIPSDKYVPYALFAHVARATLLYHVVEGQIYGFDVAVFDYPRRGGTQTGVIVSGLPVGTTPTPPGAGQVWFTVQDGHLLANRLAIRIQDLPAFVESVLAIAQRIG